MKTKSDTIVIGAGIIGLSSAYYLAKAGHSVVVLEKTDGSDSCSYGNAGFISPSHFVPLSSPGIISKGLRWMLNPESPFYIKPRLNLALAKWGWQFMRHATHKHVDKNKKLLVDMAKMSLNLYQEIAIDTDIQIENKGILLHCLTESCMKHEREVANMASDLGIATDILDIEQLNALDPSINHKGAGAVHFPGDAYTDPRAFMFQLKQSLQDLNVAVYYGEEVIDFGYDNNKISRVITSEAHFEADNVVLATGSYTAPILKLVGDNMLLEAGKGYSVDYHNSPAIPEYAYILVEARVALTPMSDFVRLAGTMELAGIDLTINRRRVAGFLKSFASYLPDFRYDDMKTLPVWAGLRPCSPDGLPYIGKDRKFNNLTIAAGHAMLGFTLGPVTGKLVAEIVDEKRTSLNINQLATDRY